MANEDKKPNPLLSQVKDPKKLVDYQEGAVVSRMLINTRGGTITLFAFDEGQRLSEHTAPFDAFVQVVEGNALITISGQEHELKEGELIIMPANEPHAVDARGRFKMMLVMIKSV